MQRGPGLQEIFMTEPRLHLPLSSAPSLVQRMCSIHQDLRPATSGCKIRPGVWLCAQCWKARYGAISGRVHRNGGAPARAPGAGQRGRALGGLIAGITVGLLIGAAVGIPVSKLKHPMAAREYQVPGLDRDAAEAERNATWDPNAPLYGKVPAGLLPDLASAKARLFAGTQQARVGARRPSDAIGASNDEFSAEHAQIAEIAQKFLQQSLPIRPNPQLRSTYPQAESR